MTHRGRNGFTLIEISIVLVIIGLIVGGVLVGHDLIKAADVRSQIAQIEQYQTAVNTFRAKYNCIPGDCIDAGTYGFIVRGTGQGQGDGNQVIEGQPGQAGQPLGLAAVPAGAGTNLPPLGHLPVAKISNGNFVMVDSFNGINYFDIQRVVTIFVFGNINTQSDYPGIPTIQAFQIDTKVDDGYPQTGKVTAVYNSYYITHWGPVWAGGLYPLSGSAGTTATVGTANTCYDNSTSADGQTASPGTQHYSTEMNGGLGLNCALSFKFK
jgi:prepilin-type N-terminal cleavage/methylation domain-containing protein